MNKRTLFRLFSIIGGPFIVVALATYFLFPFINEGRYEKVTDKHEGKKMVAEEFSENIGQDYETLVEQVDYLQTNNARLDSLVDSLKTVNQDLAEKLKAEKKEAATNDTESTEEQQRRVSQLAQRNQEKASKELAENINSILGMEIENLAPIVNQMSDEQLLLLYNEASGIQKKKLLRSLKSKEAARLIEKVIL